MFRDLVKGLIRAAVRQVHLMVGNLTVIVADGPVEEVLERLIAKSTVSNETAAIPGWGYGGRWPLPDETISGCSEGEPELWTQTIFFEQVFGQL